MGRSTRRRRTTKRRTRKQRGGAQTLLRVGGVDFQGADVFIINNYRGVDCAVLFQSNNGRPFLQLAGGRCENTHRSLEHTISEELYEESRKSIRISEDVFKAMTAAGSFVDYDGDARGLPGRRRCFICRVPFISKTIYDENKAIFDLLISPGNPAAVGKPAGHFESLLHKYLETHALARIPMEDLEKTLMAAGNNGRARSVKGQHVAKYVMTALLKKIEKGVVPFDLRTVKHKELNNDNTYMTGRKDEYAL